jgi:hypothetical protein
MRRDLVWYLFQSISPENLDLVCRAVDDIPEEAISFERPEDVLLVGRYDSARDLTEIYLTSKKSDLTDAERVIKAGIDLSFPDITEQKLDMRKDEGFTYFDVLFKVNGHSYKFSTAGGFGRYIGKILAKQLPEIS